jgi:hypothetical protein
MPTIGYVCVCSCPLVEGSCPLRWYQPQGKFTPPKYILVAADLAHFHQRWGFSIKKMKWKLFLKGHQFSTINCPGTFENDTKKVDFNAFFHGLSPKHREQVYFIRIRVLTLDSPRKIEMQKYSDGRMIITTPRLSGLNL